MKIVERFMGIVQTLRFGVYAFSLPWAICLHCFTSHCAQAFLWKCVAKLTAPAYKVQEHYMWGPG